MGGPLTLTLGMRTFRYRRIKDGARGGEGRGEGETNVARLKVDVIR